MSDQKLPSARMRPPGESREPPKVLGRNMNPCSVLPIDARESCQQFSQDLIAKTETGEIFANVTDLLDLSAKVDTLTYINFGLCAALFVIFILCIIILVRQ